MEDSVQKTPRSNSSQASGNVRATAASSPAGSPSLDGVPDCNVPDQVERQGSSSTASALRRLSDEVNSRGLMNIVAPMTLLLLVFNGPKVWTAYAPILMIASLIFFFEGLRTSKTLWLILAAFLLTSSFHHRLTDDNHKFLMSYWCLAVWTSLHATAVDKALAINGRLLVGLCFFFAVGWKIITPDFMNGAFFQHQLLFDGRFKGLAHYLANVEIESFRVNEAAWQELRRLDGNSIADVAGADRVGPLAQVMTWWTIAIEGLVAGLFLLPRRYVGFGPDIALIGFVLTTYLLAPVFGFAMILLVMGLAQCDPRHRYVRLSYIGAFCLLHLYGLPWAQIFNLTISVGFIEG